MCLSIHPCICPPLCSSSHPSIYLAIHEFIWTWTFLAIFRSSDPCVHRSFHLPVYCRSFSLSSHPSFDLSLDVRMDLAKHRNIVCNELRMLIRHRAVRKDTHTLARNEFELLLRHPAVRKDTHAGLQRIPCKHVRNEQQKAQECITVSNLTDAAAPCCGRKTYSDSSNGDEQDLVTQTIRLYCFMPLSNISVELLPAASLCLSMDLAVPQGQRVICAH